MERKYMANYITKRIESEYNLRGIEKAKYYYKSYLAIDSYKDLKDDIDKQLIDKGLEILIDKAI